MSSYWLSSYFFLSSSRLLPLLSSPSPYLPSNLPLSFSLIFNLFFSLFFLLFSSSAFSYPSLSHVFFLSSSFCLLIHCFLFLLTPPLRLPLHILSSRPFLHLRLIFLHCNCCCFLPYPLISRTFRLL